MNTPARRSAAVAAAALVAVASAGPASAEPAVSAEVRGLPAELSADLSVAEETSLSALTTGAGVPVAAVVHTGAGLDVVRLETDSRADASSAVRLLEAQPSVDAAAVSSTMRPLDTWFHQYGNEMVRSDEARADVDGPLSGVVVAVLDTGVHRHPELRSALLAGRNFTDSPGGATDSGDLHGHGTHVAGTVAADAGTDVEGVAHGARILPVKVLSDEGYGYSDWVADGIIWAADNGADVINMSLGSARADPVMAAAIGHARSRGVTIVAAAGNAGSSEPNYPAAYPGVIAVAAVDEWRRAAWFSNYGSYVDVAAPGVSIVSTYPEDRYASLSGTSMAAPHVAGVAALVEASAPALTQQQVEQALLGSATDLGPAGRDDVFGHGLVDAVRAVRAANGLERPPVVQPPGAPTGVTAQPLASSVDVGWTAPAQTGGAPVTGYTITTYRGTTPVGTTTATGTARSSVVTGLANGTAYRFAVAAVNQAGTGTASAQTAAVTPRTVPGTPTIGTATAARGAAVVRWAAPAATGGAAVSGYDVRVYSGTTLVKTVTAGPTAGSLTVGGLTPGRAYAFRVLARNVAGAGAPSGLSTAVKPLR